MKKQINTEEKGKMPNTHLFYLVDDYPPDFPPNEIPEIQLTWEEARAQNRETVDSGECYWWAHSPNCLCSKINQRTKTLMKQINIVNLADPLSQETIAQIKAHFKQEEGTEVTLNIKRYCVCLDVSPEGNIEVDVISIIEQIEKDFDRRKTALQALIPVNNPAAAHLFAQYKIIMQTDLLLIVDGKLTQVISW